MSSMVEFTGDVVVIVGTLSDCCSVDAVFDDFTAAVFSAIILATKSFIAALAIAAFVS